MFYRFSALVVALAMVAGHLPADDKKDDKKDAKDTKAEVTKIKGKVVKFDKDKKCVCLKTADGDKDYMFGDEVTIVIKNGPKLKAHLKQGEGQEGEAGKEGMEMLHSVLRDGAEVEVVMGEKTIKELHAKSAKATGLLKSIDAKKDK